ncbi:MarR family winged helix-turn-helix transcriptional regulator [Cellulomonas sp. P22]|uniref:MarR family winged helix-turn-helix transcriptional regulator n=1 Tax=Cellulomonas sp. P22 TaxID=3373189 RepID=UPI003791E394
MEDAIREVELETMLLGRHLTRIGSEGGTTRRRLDRSAYTLLSRLMIEGPMSIGELSEAFDLDTSTVHRQTASAMRDGLVERIPDPDGGLARKFRVTDEGRDRVEAERDANTVALGRIFRDWDDTDVTRLAELLGRFNSDIESLSGHPWPRGDRPAPSTTHP